MTEKCNVCNISFNIDTLLESKNNIFYCGECFRNKMYSGKMASGAGDTKTKILEARSKQFIPNIEKYVLKNGKMTTSLSSQQSVMSLSRRPLQCPRADCNKHISVSTLVSHFQHEHKEVPIISSKMDARFASEFLPSEIRYYSIQCIVLLKIVDCKFVNACDSSCLTLSNVPLEDVKPVVVLMATRIAHAYLNSDEEDEDNNDSERVMSSSSDQDVFSKRDRIIVWLASNVQTNLSYTVAVSTTDKNIRNKFYGPMYTLKEPPARLCDEGKCLILTYYHLAGMTENGTKPLTIDALIHNPQ